MMAIRDIIWSTRAILKVPPRAPSVPAIMNQGCTSRIKEDLEIRTENTRNRGRNVKKTVV